MARPAPTTAPCTCSSDRTKLVTPACVGRCAGVEPDERAWVDGLRVGQPAAFDAVFGAYRRRIYAYLLRMTRRKDAAEDLLQETFLRLAQHAKRIAADTRLGPYLFTIAHRLFISWT